MIEQGLASRDPAVQLVALRQATESTQPGRSLDAAWGFLTSDHVHLRLVALEAVGRLSPERSPDAARSALFDRSAAIRGLARWTLSRVEAQDFAAVYRRALAEAVDGVLSTPARMAGALGGLGETGTEGDLAIVLPFLGHPAARVRQARSSAHPPPASRARQAPASFGRPQLS